jgi:tetratricopeptide (TPR) repeat protein
MSAALKTDASLPPEIAKYLSILSKDPGSMVFAPLAEAYRKAGMLDEAIATAQDGLKLHPNYLSGMVALGRAYFEKGMLKEAREELERVIKMAPDNIIAANILEEIKKQEPEVEVAEVKVEERPEVVEEVKPEVIETVELKGVAEIEEVEAGEKAGVAFGEEITEELWTGEAITEEVKVEVEEKEEDVRPKKEITTSTIAELYIKQGYIDKAIDIYQTLYRANPFDEEIKRKLEELKRQAEVKVEEEGAEVGWAEPVSEAPEARGQVSEKLEPGARHLEPEVEADENIKRLKTWLKTIQSERRKV